MMHLLQLAWLGGGTLDLSDPMAEFGFARPFPAWVWALALGFVSVMVWRAYTRLEGPKWGRAVLASLRGMLLLLLLALISGPQLAKPNEIEESDWVLFLVDRSSSMQIPDGTITVPSTTSGTAAGEGPAEAERSTVSGVTRDAQLRAALEAASPGLARLSQDRTVVWFGFDAGAYELGSEKPVAGTESAIDAERVSAIPTLPPAEGVRTDVERALDQALRRAAARPISGIVLLSDGRASAEPSRAMMRRLEAERVPVFTLPLGDPAGISDVGIRRVEAPRLAFALDAVPVDAELERILAGTGDGADDQSPVVVELVDTATGEVLDTQTARWSDRPSGGAEAGADDATAEQRSQVASVRLTARGNRVGDARWVARIRSDAGRRDLIEGNNALELAVEMVDRPLRVLYIDGYPRWEYRYVKNLLIREPSVLAATLLLSPRHQYTQEGSITLESLPRSPEEWSQFDLFILGDVWPGVFTSEQLFQLRERVSLGGAGLVWIGGESHTPGSWRTSPLADLLPFTLAGDSTSAESVRVLDRPAVVVPTPEAERLGVLRLSDTPVEGSEAGPAGLTFWPPILSDASAGWNALQWVQRIGRDRLKPTAEVLAVAVPIDEALSSASATAEATSEGAPLLLSMRYGAGRVMYVATDEIWRWRYSRGDPYTERFYIQLFRLLGREALNRSGKPALLEVAPSRAQVQSSVRVRLTLLEQSLVDAEPRSVRARVVRIGEVSGDAARPTTPGETDGEVVEIVLTPELGAEAGGGGARRGGTEPSGGRAESLPSLRGFSAVFVPPRAGDYRVEVIDPLLTSRTTDLSARLEVVRTDDELLRPAADHELLDRLSTSSGGRRLAASELSQLDRLLPNRRIKVTGEPQTRTLWDSPLALLLVVGLCTAEWVGRRLMRLV